MVWGIFRDLRQLAVRFPAVLEFVVAFDKPMAAHLGLMASHRSGEMGSNSWQTPVTNHPPMKATNMEDMKVELHTYIHRCRMATACVMAHKALALNQA
jgi:hypothetical protein